MYQGTLLLTAWVWLRSRTEVCGARVETPGANVDMLAS
jgi:hypothetical protein